MAEIPIERKGGRNFWPWLIGILILIAIIWFLFSRRSTTPATPPTPATDTTATTTAPAAAPAATMPGSTSTGSTSTGGVPRNPPTSGTTPPSSRP